MKITREEVLHVARLARLKLDVAGVDAFCGQIADILAYVDKLSQVDTTGVEPTSHAISLTNALRGDEPGRHLDRDLALANAPDHENGTFLVPRIID
ncbi:MAG: Asp-tRNA(Asn)/Glu-tRNA(Gln) amidotransferase subunit GatC [Desulfobacteraceae bacterium]|nr:Asp-tRNA(Asn)/Glu-tRNA(Gln) amidotransferase subunit GatC [Desulfobacteraceae bacterium]